MIEFIEKQLKPFFCMLLLSDVRVGTKPSKHFALIVFQWLHAREEWMEASVRCFERKHHVEWFASRDGSRPPLHHRWQCTGVNHRAPSPAFYLLRSCPRVIVTPLIIPVNPSIRVRQPHQLRHEIG